MVQRRGLVDLLAVVNQTNAAAGLELIMSDAIM